MYIVAVKEFTNGFTKVYEFECDSYIQATILQDDLLLIYNNIEISIKRI